MIGEIIAVLGLIFDFAEDHPDIVKMLSERAQELLKGHDSHVLANVEAQRALAAGFAAARANAVQEFQRRKAKADQKRGT